jgi:hypothetical protein
MLQSSIDKHMFPAKEQAVKFIHITLKNSMLIKNNKIPHMH